MRVLRPLFALLIFLHLSAVVAQEQTPPIDQAGFVKYMSDRIATAAGVRVVPTDRPLTLRVLKTDGEYLLSANLDRIWTACERVQERCAAFVAEYVSGVSSAVAERLKPVEKTSLRIAVRPTSYLVAASQAQRAESPITRAFVGDLSLVLVVDGARTLRVAHKKDLEALKLSEAEAFEVAKINLGGDLKPLPSVLKPILGKSIGFLTSTRMSPVAWSFTTNGGSSPQTSGAR